MFLISELHKIKNLFSLFRQRAANFPIERMLCIDAYRINYVYQKMESQGNIAYLWEHKIIMILEHLYIFVKKTTSKSRRSRNVNTRSQSQHRKHNVVTTLVFGRSNDVRNTTFWQRCDNVIRRRDQKTTKTKRCYNVVCQLGSKMFIF